MSGRRLLRSVLFTPADRADRMRKALLSAADVVVLDLEDAVSPDKKEIARKNVVDLLHEIVAGTTQPYGTVCVRINCMKNTTWGMHDLRAISAVKCDAVLLPKVEDVSIVETAIETLESGTKWEISNKPTSVWVMIETARGVQRAEEIADTEGVSALIFGSNDLTKDLKSRHTATREPLLYSMSRCILAARAAGKQVVDGVHLDINDQNGFAISCEQGRSLGFDGKSLIHPTQIDAANKGYSPSLEDIVHAKKIMTAYDTQVTGVIQVDGRMVEKLHVEQARLLLADADDIERLEKVRSSQGLSRIVEENATPPTIP